MAGSRSILFPFRPLTAGIAVVASLVVGAVVIGLWDARPAAPLQIAQVGEPVQLAEAAAPAPKQSAPAPKQQPQPQAPKPAAPGRHISLPPWGGGGGRGGVHGRRRGGGRWRRGGCRLAE